VATFDISSATFTDSTLVGLRKKLDSRSLMDTGVAISVAAYGAKGDVLEVHDGVTTSGSTTVTSASGYFTQGDVGKLIYIQGAGTAGALLATTIAGVTSSTSITIGTAAAASLTSRKILWGTDDSTAIAAAIAATTGVQTGNRGSYNPGRYGSIVYFPPGRYLHGGITLDLRTSLIGDGHHKSVLVLKPGTNAHCITGGTAASNSADFLTIMHMGIDGTKNYRTTASTAYHGIYLYQDNDGGPEVDYFHRFLHLKIWNCAGDGMNVATSDTTALNRGESLYLDINVQNCDGYGFNLEHVDTRFLSCHAGGCGYAGFKLYTQSCQFVACKSYYNGRQGWETSISHISQGCNWIIGGWGNMFTSCQSEESYSSGFYICGGKNQFVNCKSDDTGDIAAQESETTYSGIRAAWYLDGTIPTGFTYGTGPTAWHDYNCADNYFSACHIGVAQNAGASYMTHALYVVNGAKFNKGDFHTTWTAGGTESIASRYSTALYEASSAAAAFNNLSIDGCKLADTTSNGAFSTYAPTNNVTLDVYHVGVHFRFNNGGNNRTIILPADDGWASTYDIPIGAEFTFTRLGSGTVTVDATTNSQTLQSVSSLTGVSQYGFARLRKVATSTWELSGDLA
jgi:hypothetical protein